MANILRGLLGTGRAPSVLEAQIIEIAVENGMPLDAEPILSTRAAAVAWMAANPGRVAHTSEAPPKPGEWRATAPSFDTVAGTVTIPTDAGATYTLNGATIASGTRPVTVPSTVTIRAVAKPGYTLAGTTEWVREFEEHVTAYEGIAQSLAVEHYWRLDETSGIPVDRGTGSSLDVLMQGTPEYGVGGIGGFQRSITFSGTDGRMQVQGIPVAGTTAYTHALIMRVDAGHARAFEDWATKNQVLANIPSGVWGVKGPSASGSAVTPAPTLGTVYHVAVTWDGATVTLYIDGTSALTFADAGPEAGAAALRVAYTAGAGNAATAAGVIVDHTKALTGAQIKALSDAVIR